MSHNSGGGKRPPTSPRAGVGKKGKNGGRARRDPDDVYDNEGKILHDGNSTLYEYGTNVRDIVEHPLVEATLGESSPLAGITSSNIRTGVSNFQNDGRRGFNDPDFLRQAVEASGQRSNGDFDDYLDSRFRENWVDEEDDAEYARSEGENVQDNDDESFAVQHPGDQAPGLQYRKKDRDDDEDDPSRYVATQTSVSSSRPSGSTHISTPNETSSNGTSNSGFNGTFSGVSIGLDNQISHYANLAAVPHPPLLVMESYTSNQKMDVLWHANHPDQQSFPGTLLQAGDILRFQDGSWFKDARLISFLPEPAIVELPAAGNQTFAPGSPVIRYANITGPLGIAKAIRQMEPNAPLDAVPNRIWNADIKVYRSQVYLGLLSDIRQAYLFHENEAKWFAALKFKGCGISFRSHLKAAQEGYWIDSKMGVLCKKIPIQWLQHHDQSTIIDLSHPLNAQLAACADKNSGCVIVFVDIRALCQGLPFSKEQNQAIKVPVGNPSTPLSKAWLFGPASFATPFLQTLASRGHSVSEWSKGHAHITSSCLYSNGKLWASGHRPPKNQFPAGFIISAREKLKILAFWEDHIKDQVEHWPVPINRAGVSHSNIIATQRIFVPATMPFTASATPRASKPKAMRTRTRPSSPDSWNSKHQFYKSAPQIFATRASDYPILDHNSATGQDDDYLEFDSEDDNMDNIPHRTRHTNNRSASPNPYAGAVLATRNMYGIQALPGVHLYNDHTSNSGDTSVASNDCIDPALEGSNPIFTSTSRHNNPMAIGYNTIVNVPYRSSRFADSLPDSGLENSSSAYLPVNNGRPNTSGSDRPTTSSSFASNIINDFDQDTAASGYETAASEFDEDATIWDSSDGIKTPPLGGEKWGDSNPDQPAFDSQINQDMYLNSEQFSLQEYNTPLVRRTLFEFMTGIPEALSTPLMKRPKYLYEHLTVKPGTRTQFRALLLALPDVMLAPNDRENLYLGMMAQLKYNMLMHMPEKQYLRACWETVLKGGHAKDYDPHTVSQAWIDNHSPCAWLVGEGQIVIARSSAEAVVTASTANKHAASERYHPSPYT